MVVRDYLRIKKCTMLTIFYLHQTRDFTLISRSPSRRLVPCKISIAGHCNILHLFVPDIYGSEMDAESSAFAAEASSFCLQCISSRLIGLYVLRIFGQLILGSLQPYLSTS